MAETKPADTKPPEVKSAEVGTKAGESTLFAGSGKGAGPQPGNEPGTPVRAHGDIDAPGDGEPEHGAVVNMAKHLDAWAQSFGEDALERAVELAGTYRDERQAAADEAAKADAARDRAASGQQSGGAPVGRSAAGKSTT